MDIDRLNKKLTNSYTVTDSGCWEWKNYKNRGGYGVINIDNTTYLVHRIAWWAHHRQTPPSHLKVCHTCDNRACINPTHLFLGTQLDNVRDCLRKGRFTRKGNSGEKHPLAILNEDKVVAILRDSRKYKDIAASYGCAESTIGMIKRGWNWPHVYAREKERMT